MLTTILKETQHFFKPFKRIAESEHILYEVEKLLIQIGLLERFDESHNQGIINTCEHLVKDISATIGTLKDITEKGDLSLEDLQNMESQLAEIFASMEALKDLTFENIALHKLPQKLLDYLWVNYFYHYQPILFYLFSLLKVIKLDEEEEKEIYTFRPEVLLQLLSAPKRWFEKEYRWSQEDFQADEFLERLYFLSIYLGFLVRFVEEEVVDTASFTDDTIDRPTLQLPFFSARLNKKYTEVGLSLSKFLHADENIAGLKVFPHSTLKGLSFEQTLKNEWLLKLHSTIDLEAPVGLIFYDDVVKLGSFQSDALAPSNDLHFVFELAKLAASERKEGELSSKSLQINSIGIRLGLTLSKNPSLHFALLLSGVTLTMDTKEADSFLQEIISDAAVSPSFDCSLGWNNRDGFQLGGNAGMELTIPIHQKLAFAQLKTVELGIFLKDNEIDLKGSCSFNAWLGPLFFEVDRIGTGSKIKLGERGNLGIMQLEPPRFISPRELTLAIENPIVNGGGSVRNYAEDQSYAGILALNLQVIELTAIGIISTQLPNNASGFSLLVSINTIFKPAFQLPFGFTLIGVGGLLGLNRTINVDALRERIANGAINSIMFPENPIENTDRILGDLRAVFPTKGGHFVVAPFLRIGYGTPSIVEVDLGVLIEVPFKDRIILLGSVGIYLPNKATPLIEIHIDVLGDLNLAAKCIRIDGRLRDSHIMQIDLTGGFAFLLDWGDDPAFLFSIGGYHPRYNKPDRFPEIPRLTAMIKKGDHLLLFCDFYQAITSNSFQIGFRAGLVIKYKDARLEGYLGFNALIQFDPFYFEVDIGMTVDVSYKGKSLVGVDLYFSLIGPSPWLANGYARIKVLMIPFKVKFRHEWGDKKVDIPTRFQASDIYRKVKTALEAAQNWSAKLPADFLTGEYLRPADEVAAEALVLHPSGYLEVRQSIVPLHRSIGKYGNIDVEDTPTFSVIADTAQVLMGLFPRAQFEDLSDAEKISTPDFEEMEAGLSFAKGDSNDFTLGYMESDGMDGAFENIIVKADLSQYGPERSKKCLEHERDFFAQKQVIRGSRRNRKRFQKRIARYQLPDDAPRMQLDQAYCIVFTSNLNRVPRTILGRVNKFSTRAEAKACLRTRGQNEKHRFKIMTIESFQLA